MYRLSINQICHPLKNPRGDENQCLIEVDIFGFGHRELGINMSTLIHFMLYVFHFRLLLWLFVKSLSATVHGQMIIFASKSTIFQVILAVKFVCYIPSNRFLLLLLCRYHNVNINVAVQTDHGLFVPVIRVSHDLCLIL